MPITPITSADQITLEWLTSVLQREGVLPHGQVMHIQATTFATNTATAFPLQITYSSDAPDTAPRSLFLKLGRRKPEVDFVNVLTPAMQNPPVVRCYDAAFYNELGVSHLLFDDVTTSHTTAEDTLPQSRAVCERLVEILAGLHAQWWEHPRLATDIGDLSSQDGVMAMLLRIAHEQFPKFVDALGDRLSDKRREVYEKLLAVWPVNSLASRMKSCNAVTVVHGDCHFWNFLYPYKNEGPVFLNDWAVWHINIPTYDVAYLVGLHTSSEWRARHEESLVRHYYARLLAGGVSNYDWHQCWHDYRIAIIGHLFWPIFWWQFTPATIWWYGLENVMSAFEDLHGRELLT